MFKLMRKKIITILAIFFLNGPIGGFSFQTFTEKNKQVKSGYPFVKGYEDVQIYHWFRMCIFSSFKTTTKMMHN